MTDPVRHRRHRYAHRASRGRESGFAIVAGVVLVALCVPLAWRALSDDSGGGIGLRRSATTQSPRSSSIAPTSGPSKTGSTAHSSVRPGSTQPGATPIPSLDPGVVIQVVPAVRDVQILVDQTLYTTSSDGIVTVPDARGKVNVSYVGYSVIPALQEVTFRYWSDGLKSSERSVDADGHGHMSLAVDVRYRVTVQITRRAPSGTSMLTATSSVGSVQFTDGSRRWVLAKRGQLSGEDVVERNITYSFDAPPGSPVGQRQQFTASPEALWMVQAP